MDVAIVIGLYVYKVFCYQPRIPYLHLLVDYHFGFAKRSLIGAAVSLFLAKVPVWFVFVIGPAVILVALLLFLLLFKRTFGFRNENLPLLAFVAGSPFFIKNFVQNIGYQDVYGCIFAIVLLLIPARSFLYVVIAAFGSAVLVMIHHLHFLLYVPTIGVIVAMRYYFAHGVTLLNLLGGAFLVTAIATLTVVAQFYGSIPAPIEKSFPIYRARPPTRTTSSNCSMSRFGIGRSKTTCSGRAMGLSTTSCAFRSTCY